MIDMNKKKNNKRNINVNNLKHYKFGYLFFYYFFYYNNDYIKINHLFILIYNTIYLNAWIKFESNESVTLGIIYNKYFSLFTDSNLGSIIVIYHIRPPNITIINDKRIFANKYGIFLKIS